MFLNAYMVKMLMGFYDVLPPLQPTGLHTPSLKKGGKLVCDGYAEPCSMLIYSCEGMMVCKVMRFANCPK